MRITESSLRRIVREEIMMESVRSGRMSLREAREDMDEGLFDKVKSLFTKKDPEAAKRAENVLKLIGSVKKFYVGTGEDNVTFEVLGVDKSGYAKTKVTVKSMTIEPGRDGESFFKLDGPFTTEMRVEKKFTSGGDQKLANEFAAQVATAFTVPVIAAYSKKYPDVKKRESEINDLLVKASVEGASQTFKYSGRILSKFVEAFKAKSGG